ncbi:MAG: hypothetical protein [Siphoviridae sp. ctvD11]|nr:MAG: hypothetical protein [Siphoviridae sp. ctvD11]
MTDLTTLVQDISKAETHMVTMQHQYEQEKLKVLLEEAATREILRAKEAKLTVQALEDKATLDQGVQEARRKLLDCKLSYELSKVHYESAVNNFAAARKDATLQAAKISLGIETA